MYVLRKEAGKCRPLGLYLLSPNELQAGFAALDGDVFHQILFPGGVRLVSQIGGGLGLPAAQVHAGEVHDVSAILGVHHTGVTGLAGGVEAPVVEFRYHLALIDLCVEAAVVLGAVGGFLHSQGGEGVLGRLARLPLGQNFLGLGVGVGLQLGLFVLITLFALGNGAGSKGDQNMANVNGGVLVPEAVVEDQHVLDGAVRHSAFWL